MTEFSPPQGPGKPSGDSESSAHAVGSRSRLVHPTTHVDTTRLAEMVDGDVVAAGHHGQID